MNEQHRVLIYDLETTGDDHRRHRIIQFAGIAADSVSLEPVEEFEIKVKIDPRMPYELEALAGNVFGKTLYPDGVPRAAPSREFPKGKPLFKDVDVDSWNAISRDDREAHAEVDAFLRRHQTVRAVSKRTGGRYKVARVGGHNVATFDAPFLTAWYGKRFCPAGFKCLDTLHLASWIAFLLGYDQNDPELNMCALCEKHGIALVGAHDALVDVRANLQLIRSLRDELRSGIAGAKWA